MSVLENYRLKDLQITLKQLRVSIPETDGALRRELERQQRDVEREIARVIAAVPWEQL